MSDTKEWTAKTATWDNTRYDAYIATVAAAGWPDQWPIWMTPTRATVGTTLDSTDFTVQAFCDER